MTPPPSDDLDANQSLLCTVLDGGEIAVVRIVGRGNFSNSMALKRFAAHVQKRSRNLRFIIDMQQCEAMDSTFMGVLAGIALTHVQNKLPKIIALNPSEHCKRLMRNLGLTHLLEIRQGPMQELSRAEDALTPADAGESSRLDQIFLTLQAHKELVKLDEQNEVRFQAVIEYLEKSLEAEQQEAKGN